MVFQNGCVNGFRVSSACGEGVGVGVGMWAAVCEDEKIVAGENQVSESEWRSRYGEAVTYKPFLYFFFRETVDERIFHP